MAATSLLAGVHAARRDGAGMDCDVSLFDVAISMLSYPATWHLNGGFTPERTARSAHPSLVPFQNFPTADGWIVIGCAKEKFFGRLAEAIGRPSLAGDTRFATFEDRSAHRDELVSILDAELAGRTTAEWLELLTAAGVPCGPVNTVEQALADPQTKARGMIVETDHPRFGRLRQPASPVRVGEPPSVHRRAPQRDEDAGYVLRELLGYSRERVEVLRKEGAFGDQSSDTRRSPAT